MVPIKRKVIQLAGSTLVVSLPSKWAKKHNILKGDEIGVEERGRELVIKSESESAMETTQFDTTGLSDRVIRWGLSALHKKGFDEIEVFYDNPQTIELVQELLKDLFIGFVITNQTDKKCMLKSVARDMESEFDTTLRRAFLVTITMGENALEFIKQKQYSLLATLQSLEKTNNQLTNFCERILNKQGHPEYKNTCFYYVVVWNLEKICDDYKHICNYLSTQDQKKAISKELVTFFEEANNFLKEYYSLFYKFDINKLSALANKRKELIKTGRELLKKSSEVEVVVVSILLDFVLKVSEFSASKIALSKVFTATPFD